MASSFFPQDYRVKVNPDKKSYAWKYFGHLVRVDEETIHLDNDHVYCSLCFEAGLNSGEVTDLKALKRYKSSVASGNLLKHLDVAHDITVPADDSSRNAYNSTNKAKRLSTFARKNRLKFPAARGSSLNISPTLSHQPSPLPFSKSKAFGIDLALWFCKDGMPFSAVSKPGFQEFLQKYKLVKTLEKIPSPAKLSTDSLNSIYISILANVKKEVSKNPGKVAIAMDLWSDHYRYVSYITFNIHFVQQDFTIRNMTLRTCLLHHPPNSHTIVTEMRKTLEMFQLVDTMVLYVTDGTASMVEACHVATVGQESCVAHMLNCLIVHDGLGNSPDIERLILRATQVIRFLCVKTEDILHDENIQDQDFVRQLLQVRDIMDADTQYPVILEDNYIALVTIDSAQVSAFTTSFKKDFLSRWTTILAIVDFFVANKVKILWILDKIVDENLNISEEEWELLIEINEFLCSFRKAAEMMSGFKYAPMNLVLLFRAECLASLSPQPQDSPIVARLKDSMTKNFEKTFPLSELHVCGALLDPSLQRLKIIDDYLFQHNFNREHFLKDMYKRYARASESTFGLELATEEPEPSALDSQPQWKRLKMELVGKHTAVNQMGPSGEIQQFLSLSAVVDDPLLWWKQNAKSFPCLAELARGVLGIPATRGSTERMFSPLGAMLTADRSSVCPSEINRRLFIQENHDLLTAIF